VLPKEVTSWIGKSGSGITFYVERGAVERYADAVGETNPLYWNDEFAKKSRYGSVIAPPGFFGLSSPFQRESDPSRKPISWVSIGETLSKVGYGRVVNGGMELEFFTPAHPGDVLQTSSVVKDIVEREGRSGKMVLVTIETTYVNHKGEMVAKQRHTTIHR
jgi:acyl dehydratase